MVVVAVLAGGDGAAAAPLSFQVLPSSNPAAPRPSSGMLAEVGPGGISGGFRLDAERVDNLKAARDAIRAATGRTSAGQTAVPSNWEGAIVTLLAGTHYLSETFTLDSRDSGTAAKPVVYRAADGAQVVINGAYPVADSSWTLVTSADTFGWARLPAATRASTYVLNVGALGINKGENGANGYSYVSDQLLLIDNTAIVQRSSFPEGDPALAGSWLSITAATDGGYDNISTFTVDSSTPASWNESGQDIYAYGFLGEAWFSAWERLSTIIASGASSVSTIPNRNGAYPTTSANQKFLRFSNVMEAMSPGHCVWAQTQGKLYYLPGSGAPSGVSLTLLPTVITFGVDESSSSAPNFVGFEGIVFEGTRNNQVEVYRSTGVTFTNCTFRNGSGGGPYFEDVTNCHMVGCTVSGFMDQGAMWSNVGNGSKSTLTESGCSVENSTFAGNCWGQQSQNKGALAIVDNGCGFDVQSTAFVGNASNAIYGAAALVRIDSCSFNGDSYLVGDNGAIYFGRKQTDVGLEVTHCTFTNIRKHPNHAASHGAVFPVYMDDCNSWATITDNTFTNCDSAMYLASGKGLIVRRNKFTNCDDGHNGVPVILADRQPYGFDADLEADLAAWPVTAEPWNTAWPLVKNLRPGQSLRTPTDHLKRFYGLVFRDNMATDGTYIARIHTNALPYVDATQLNYPIGASGTPVNGGGTVQLGTIDRQ